MPAAVSARVLEPDEGDENEGDEEGLAFDQGADLQLVPLGLDQVFFPVARNQPFVDLAGPLVDQGHVEQGLAAVLAGGTRPSPLVLEPKPFQVLLVSDLKAGYMRHRASQNTRTRDPAAQDPGSLWFQWNSSTAAGPVALCF